jgi:hypothetical protein
MSVKNQVIFGQPSYDYTVTVSANPASGGTVSGGGGLYYYGQPITITATPNEGYVFDYWTRYNEQYGYDEVVSYLSPDDVPVTGNDEFVAHFHQEDGIIVGEPNHTNRYLPYYTEYPYTMTQQIYTAAELNSGPCDISSVTFFNTGYSETRNLTVYMFNTNKTKFNSMYDWLSVNEVYQVYSGIVSPEQNGWTTIYFNTPFAYDGVSNVALVVNDATGDWGWGMSCRTFDTEDAQALYFYGYDYGFDPSNPYSDYYPELLNEKNQVVFGVANYQYTVTVSANPEEGGTVSGGGGPYYYGQPITLIATPNEGYVFNSWTKDGEVVSCSSTFILSVTESGEYVANFEQFDGTLIGEGTESYVYLPSYSYYCYTLSQQIYTADEIGMEPGEISSISFFNTGETRTRNYTVYMVNTNKMYFNDNYDWITVSEADQVFSGNVTFTKGSWSTVYLNTPFNYDGTSNIALIIDDNTGSFTYPPMSCRVYPTQSNQSMYIYSDGTNYDPYNPSGYWGSFPMLKNQIILGVPSYEYTVSVTVDPANGGTVSGNDGYYYLGQTCTLTATANAGYCFYNWTMDGTVVSTSETYSFPVTGNMHLVANFGTPISITAAASPEEGGTVTGGGNYALGHTCTLTASANNKFVFLNWSKNGTVVSYLSTYSFTVTEDEEYVANFQRVSNGIVMGDAASSSNNLPSYTYYPYYFSQQIYTADEIGMECDIASVAFFNTSSYSPTRNFAIYLIPTDKTSFTGSYDWVTATEDNQVFSGTVTIQSCAWTVFTFDTPFHYDGTSNLALVVDDNSGSYGTNVPFRTYAANGYQSMYCSSYSTNFDPLSPTSYGNRLSVKNQVIFGFPSSDCMVTVSSEPSYGGTVTGGGTFAYGQLCAVSATANEGYCFYNWTENDVVVSTDTDYSFQVTGSRDLVAHFGTAVVVTASASPEEGGTVSGSGSYAPGHACSLTATANEGYAFMSWTKDGQVVSYLSSYAFIAEENAEYVANFEPVNYGVVVGDAFGTNQYLPSNSYYNYSLSQQIYTAEELGGAHEISSIAFFNAGNTKSRNFTIYLKHTEKAAFDSNTDWIPVTYSDQVYYGSATMTAGQWTYINFDAPFAYNGISNLVLVVDDNTGGYSYGMNCRVFVADGTQTLQVVGDDVNYNPHNPSNYTGSLMSLKNHVIFGITPAVVQQTDVLEVGWNWWSTYLDITLNDLKSALVAAMPGATNIVIKSQSNGQTTYNGSTWRGQLTTLDVTQMYRIKVQTSAELTLTGTRINPAEHPVTITSGTNWIGFPLGENKTLGNAFAGFAVSGDVVKSQSGLSTFNGTTWRGGISSLEPGKGYIYKSNVQGTRTFTFPANAK